MTTTDDQNLDPTCSGSGAEVQASMPEWTPQWAPQSRPCPRCGLEVRIARYLTARPGVACLARHPAPAAPAPPPPVALEPQGYNEKLRAGEQVDAEEAIASILADVLADSDDEREFLHEETASRLGRLVLLEVLSRFRPDLMSARQ